MCKLEHTYITQYKKSTQIVFSVSTPNTVHVMNDIITRIAPDVRETSTAIEYYCIETW
jgi:hypothetical protein